MAQKFNIGDTYKVPATGSEPFWWSFSNADDEEYVVVTVQDASVDAPYKSVDKENNVWNNNTHGACVLAKTEGGSFQWLPASILTDKL